MIHDQASVRRQILTCPLQARSSSQASKCLSETSRKAEEIAEVEELTRRCEKRRKSHARSRRQNATMITSANTIIAAALWRVAATGDATCVRITTGPAIGQESDQVTDRVIEEVTD